MYLPFTKMHGAGNDFVVLDETRGTYGLTPAQYRWLADRRFGVGADQILTVRSVSPEWRAQGVDFEYVIHNADGSEVEQCGNGARCFVRFVREKGLTARDTVTVKVKKGVITLRMDCDGRVTVDMGAPAFALPDVPFDPAHAQAVPTPQDWPLWQLSEAGGRPAGGNTAQPVAVVSMGNPHAVQFVADVDVAPVAEVGAWVESHPAFPARVNAGFLQVLDRRHARIRVYERGAGETLACGTGTCAAVVAGIRLGLLDTRVDVQARGGRLTIEWVGEPQAPVYMTGPAQTVFHGEVEVPDLPDESQAESMAGN